MLGLPKSTELKKQLPKTTLYSKFQMSKEDEKRMDADISRLTFVNEVSSSRINIAAGKNASKFFVLLVSLKRKEFENWSIAMISKLIDQNMLLILQYGEEAKLAVYHTKLMQTEWMKADSLSIDIKGLNMDTVWDNIVAQVGGFTIEQGNTLDKQIAIEERRAKLQRELDRLTRQVKAEKQPKKKFELVQQIKELQKEKVEK